MSEETAREGSHECTLAPSVSCDGSTVSLMLAASQPVGGVTLTGGPLCCHRIAARLC